MHLVNSISFIFRFSQQTFTMTSIQKEVTGLHCPQNTLLSLLTVWRRRRSHRKNMISKLRRWAPSWENDCILAPDPFIKKIRTLYSLQLLKLKEIKWSYFFNLKLRGRVIINLKKALRLQNIVLTNLSYCSLKWRHIYRRHPGTVYLVAKNTVPTRTVDAVEY